MTIRQAILEAVQAFDAAGVPDSRIDAELILCHVTGLDRMNLLMSGANELTKELLERIEDTLFRCGIVILRYENANDSERTVAFSPAGTQTEAPAILREKDGLIYEKGRK